MCAASLRLGAAYCGRCGARQGEMIPREAGVGGASHDPRPIGSVRIATPLIAGAIAGVIIGVVLVAIAP